MRAADCHPDRAHCAKGLCRKCYTARKSAEWYQQNKPHVLANGKRWRRANLERFAHTQRVAALRRTYGIVAEEYDAMLQRQHGVCAICLRPESSKKRPALKVDHDHRTGEVRGLLCNVCNIAMSVIDAVPFAATRLAEYAARHASGLQ